MNLTALDLLAILAALLAVFMVGSGQLRLNLHLYAWQTLLIAVATACLAHMRAEPHLYLIAICIAALKAVGIPCFLTHIVRKISVNNDPGYSLASPVAMHLCIGLLGLSYFLSKELPAYPVEGQSWATATASVSLLLTGLIVMLTRRFALSQIIGFLVMENGIYLFAQTQTSGMPLVVEMGILLDLLVAVMISGLMVFRIKTSFEHIDVTQLSQLKD